MHAPLHTFHALSKKKIPEWVSDHHTAFNQPICLRQLIPVSYTCGFLLLPKGQLEYAVWQQLFITLLQVSPHASSLPFPPLPFLSPCSTNSRGSCFPPLLLLSRLENTAGKQELLGENISSRSRSRFMQL